MREILFRGKTPEGKWVEGYFFETTTPVYRAFIITNMSVDITDGCTDILDFSIVEVDPETAGQYTGLTDKNGKEIFEGDIVKAYKHNEEPFICAITYRNGCFWFGNWNWVELLNIFRNYEIIGNIFDNPELLKGGAE